MIVENKRTCVILPRYRMSHSKVDNLTSDAASHLESSETLLKKVSGITKCKNSLLYLD